jgi:hypothetical protein
VTISVNLIEQRCVVLFQDAEFVHGEVSPAQCDPVGCANSRHPDEFDLVLVLFRPGVQPRFEVVAVRARIGEELHDLDLVASNPSWFVDELVVLSFDKLSKGRFREHHRIEVSEYADDGHDDDANDDLLPE